MVPALKGRIRNKKHETPCHVAGDAQWWDAMHIRTCTHGIQIHISELFSMHDYIFNIEIHTNVTVVSSHLEYHLCELPKETH